MFSLLSLFLLSFHLASALPSSGYVPRQLASVSAPAALASPTSITVQTVNGTMTETCVYTFTPVGQQIQEVKNCTVSEAFQATTTLVAASTASPTAAAAFVMPGTAIQVLPVGLGIYGGITAIAVAAVVLVTLERVQYRKSFRRQMALERRSYGYIGKS